MITGAAILVLWLAILAPQWISDWHILQKSNIYFKRNKKICTKAKLEGKSILGMYDTYLSCIEHLGLNKTVRCSRAIVSNSTYNPTKYLLKYSNIEKTVDDIEKLEFISNFMIKYETFTEKMDETRHQIKNSLPVFYKIFADEDKLPYTVCGLDYNLAYIKKPFLHFLYISPAGRNNDENKLIIDAQTIKMLTNEISSSINRKGHSKLQRSMMTNDLREAVKNRDNYTCCKCGNSVYNEPNLLLEVDHIVPVSKGGKTEASNLQTLCWRCNRRKSNT